MKGLGFTELRQTRKIIILLKLKGDLWYVGSMSCSGRVLGGSWGAVTTAIRASIVLIPLMPRQKP